MTRIAVVLIVCSAALGLVAQQRYAATPSLPGFEVTSLLPRETSPGHYRQVEDSSLQELAAKGWELVGVTPYVYRNEEHDNGEMHGPKPVVTQVYPAYYFKRLRASR
jgi:hypothetical protein